MSATKQSPQQLEAELIEKMLATYGELNYSHPSSFFTATSDFAKSRVEWGYVCHAPLARWTPGHDVLFTAVPAATELDLAYIRWLISGPFRGFSDKISLKQHVTGHYYLKCDELDKWPSNVLYNFCIATRMPVENRQYLERWDVFKQAGIDPSLSFLLSINSITVDKELTAPWEYRVRGANTGVGNSNHHWFDTKTSWARIINGDVIADLAPESSFKANPNLCRPCNQIWYGKAPQAEFEALLKKDVEELCGIFGLPGKAKPVMIQEFKNVRPKGKKIAIEEPPKLVKVLNFNVQAEAAQWMINPAGGVVPFPGMVIEHQQPLHPPIDGWEDDDDFVDDEFNDDHPDDDEIEDEEF